MKDIGPGSLVRCVRSSDPNQLWMGETPVVAGRVYRVRDIERGHCNADPAQGDLFLEEIKGPLVICKCAGCGEIIKTERCLDKKSFVLIDDEDIAIFRQLVADPPKELVG